MDGDKIVREQLLSLLKGGNAHIRFNDAVRGFPAKHINSTLPNVPYSFWHLLEHMRITQNDILDFIENPRYRYLGWPKDYWPRKGSMATKRDWGDSIASFNSDSERLQGIVRNPKIDLYAKIPHGTGQSIAREIMLVADHTAYHLGEFVVMKRAIGEWKGK
ncbi:MAG: DinB family protein [Candidatus Micrarchaeota archaeon]|nr:DinB family protein [Candidatus Micrarchaeota archaeon]